MWIWFINRNNWQHSTQSAICVKQFDKKYIKRGDHGKRKFETNSSHTSSWKTSIINQQKQQPKKSPTDMPSPVKTDFPKGSLSVIFR